MSKTISRRAFLKGAGTGVIAAVGTGFIKLDPSRVHAQGFWDESADVVVVGYGSAGGAAAIAAAHAGADVLILERMASYGGSSRNSGGIIYMGGGTPIQKSNGFDDTPEEMYKYLMAAMGPGADSERIRLYSDGSVDMFNWLVSLGVPFKNSYVPGKVVQPMTDDCLSFSGNEAVSPFSEIAKPAPRGHKVRGEGSTGYILMSIFDENAKSAGARVKYDVMTERLVVSEDRVVGVEITSNGRKQYVRARKGVVLSTGGFQFNEAMMAFHAPEYLQATAPLGMHGEDGSGIRMAQAIGAETVHMGWASPWKFIYSPGTMCKSILVNNRGLRFINEDRYGGDVGEAIIRDQDATSYLIMDDAVMKELGDFAETLDPIAVSDTIEGLARKLDVPEDALRNTLSFYNEQAAKRGEDVLYDKKAEFVQPLDTPPYYALDFTGQANVTYITLGGLWTDTRSRVLDVFGDRIPGLYAAGRSTNGISANFYNSGTSLGDCIFFGRVAGDNAAREDGWV